MKIKSKVINGKTRILVTFSASGVDKTREAVLKVMGPGWEYKDKKECAN